MQIWICNHIFLQRDLGKLAFWIFSWTDLPCIRFLLMLHLPALLLAVSPGIFGQIQPSFAGGSKVGRFGVAQAISNSVSPSPVGQATNSSGTATVFVTNHGGSVISNVEITPIFYNASVNYQSDLVSFYNFLPTSSYMSVFAQYSTSSQTIGTGRYVTSYTETRATKSLLNDTADIQPYLRALVQSGTLSPNANSYYPLHTAPGITIKQTGVGTSCVDFCGYHGAVYIADLSASTSWLNYAVIPDHGGPCQYVCGTGNVLQNLCSVASHELSEAITDPQLRTWYNAATNEIGDICNSIQGSLVDSHGYKWTVQKNWSNSDKACVLSSNAKPTTTSAVSTPSPSPTILTYYQGPVLANVEVTTIFWGPSSNQARIEQYYEFITNSGWMDIMSEYSAKGKIIGRGTWKASLVRNSTGSTFDDVKDIQPYLSHILWLANLRDDVCLSERDRYF
ncbi:hypothetical protein BC830DRAFT_515751 [Chytriomyces sp. MP71]|nr:hypothetical protein BC830DRAFT_515751 [Chytriomyces sp. MP71]